MTLTGCVFYYQTNINLISNSMHERCKQPENHFVPEQILKLLYIYLYIIFISLLQATNKINNKKKATIHTPSATHKLRLYKHISVTIYFFISNDIKYCNALHLEFICLLNKCISLQFCLCNCE